MAFPSLSAPVRRSAPPVRWRSQCQCASAYRHGAHTARAFRARICARPGALLFAHGLQQLTPQRNSASGPESARD